LPSPGTDVTVQFRAVFIGGVPPESRNAMSSEQKRWFRVEGYMTYWAGAVVQAANKEEARNLFFETCEDCMERELDDQMVFGVEEIDGPPVRVVLH
jgi:hypothetical protein